MSAASYVHGASSVPLLGETIGENLRRTVERSPIARRWSSAHQDYRPPIASSGTQTDAGGARPPGPRRPEGRPRRHLVAQSLRVGGAPVRHGPHRRHPGQHQPGLQDRRARVRPAAVRHQPAAPGPRLPAATTSACWTRCATDCPDLRAVARPRRRLAGACSPTATRRHASATLARAARRRSSSTTPSTSSTPRARPAFPRAPRCRTTTS